MATVEDLDPTLRELSIAELFKRMAGDVGTLIRQEIDLAKAEVTEKIREAGAAAGLFAGALVLAMLAAGALTACFILLLALAMPGWVAALIVTVAYGAIAAALAVVGQRRLRAAAPPVPEETMETLKEDVKWLKHPTA
ncbi:MAG: hypothetical protein QOE83_864 [Actinomycetota bacterium]|jgi:uncharacterized membrane protein YqjE|nr:hypothetical protein [Actinomycetota bacterium]